MPPPVTARVGFWLIGLTVVMDLVASLWPRPGMHPHIGQAAFTLAIYGGLLYAMAHRRNWARLTFAFLYIVSLAVSIPMMTKHQSVEVTTAIVAFVLILLQGAGLVCLFLPRAAAWYHLGKGSSVTSA
jgi:hypothetical protein